MKKKRVRRSIKLIDQILTEEYLEKAYVEEKKSYDTISKETGIPSTTIGYRVKKFGLERMSLHGGDLGGLRFGRLSVLRFSRSINNRRYWWCCCDCGVEKEVSGSSLSQGRSKSCGCLPKDMFFKGYRDISGSYWSRIQISATKRNILFDLTIQELWEVWEAQEGTCALTGRKLVLQRNFSNNGQYQTASIDRINSNLGYRKDNIQWVHKDINWAKRALSQEDFIKLCSEVYVYSNNKEG